MGLSQRTTSPSVDQFPTTSETREPNASCFGCSTQTQRSVSQLMGSSTIDITRLSSDALPNCLMIPPRSSQRSMRRAKDAVNWPARCWCKKYTITSLQKESSYHNIALIWEMDISCLWSFCTPYHHHGDHTFRPWAPSAMWGHLSLYSSPSQRLFLHALQVPMIQTCTFILFRHWKHVTLSSCSLSYVWLIGDGWITCGNHFWLSRAYYIRFSGRHFRLRSISHSFFAPMSLHCRVPSSYPLL